MMNQIVLENCTLLDCADGQFHPNTNVLIEGDRVAKVDGLSLGDDTAHRIDVGGRTLMPGLIDAHVHVMAAWIDHNRCVAETEGLNALRARPIMMDMLQRGFTTVRDAGGADWGIAQAVEEGLIEGPRLFFSGMALSQTGGHSDLRPLTMTGESHLPRPYVGIIADGVAEVRKAAREQLRTGATQVKIMASGGVASPRDPIGNMQYSEEEISAIVWEATSWHTYVMAHAYRPDTIDRIVRLGVRSVEHCNLIDSETAELMVAHDAFMVPTLITYEALLREGKNWGLKDDNLEKLREVREMGLASLEVARNTGVKMGFGTDLLGETHHYQSGEFSLRNKVLSSLEIIQSATTVNAELLNRPGELGVIAPGAFADMIAVDGDPLDDISLLEGQGENLSLIIKAGKIYKNGMAAGRQAER